MKHFNIALILGIFAALGNMAGAFLLPQRKGHTIFINSMISIGAGCMMGVVVLEMIPESMKLSEQAPLFLILGFMTAHFFEHMVAPHFHFGEETHPEAMVSKLTATSAIVGLSIHSLFDGVSIGSGFLVDESFGWLIFLAIFLHKLPEGFTISSIIISAGQRKKISILIAIAIGILTIGGVSLTYFLSHLVFFALPFSAGITLYVAASDLIPLINEFKGKKYSIMLFTGFIIYYFSHRIIHIFVH